MIRKPSTFSPYSYYGSAQSRRPVIPPVSPPKAPISYFGFLRRLIAWRPARVVAGLLVIALVFHGGWSMHVAAEEAAYQQQQLAAAQATQAKSKIFAGQVADLLSGAPGVTVSVAVVSSSLGIQEFGSKQVYDAASTGKVLTAMTFLRQVEAGKASLSQTIQGQTARDLLDAMIVKSDDPSWTILNGYLTHARLQDEARTLGLTSYTADGNTLSARDMANLLSDLNGGDILRPEYRQLLLSEMAQANYRDYIVPAVNLGYQVFHKVGLDADTVNDAAIIKNGSKTLVLVIYTDGHGTFNWVARAALMQAITRDAEAAYL